MRVAEEYLYMAHDHEPADATLRKWVWHLEWTCHAFVVLGVFIYATFRSKAQGLFQPSAACFLRVLLGAIDVIEEFQFSGASGGPILPPDQLRHDGFEEVRHCGVVIAIAFSNHG